MPKRDPVANPTKQQLRRLRKTYAALKKRGIVLAKASPSKVKLTPALRKKLVTLQPIATGKAYVLPIVRTPVGSKSAAKKSYIEAGHMVIGDKLIIPKKPRTIAYIDKKGFVTTRSKHGEGFITRVMLPIPYIDLAQWIEDASKLKLLEKLKASNERWGFSFFGNNSHFTFSNLKEMLERFRYYLSVDKAIEDDNASEMGDLFRNLEIVRIQRPTEDYWEANKGTKGGGDARVERQQQTNAEYKRDLRRGGSRKQVQRQRMKRRNPKRYQSFLKIDAARKRYYRARLKGKAKKIYLAKERARWKRRNSK